MVYKITGRFYPGIPWEDFFSNEGPSVTIASGGTFRCIKHLNDGWYDVIVPVLNCDVARAVLALINNCRSEDVVINEAPSNQACLSL